MGFTRFLKRFCSKRGISICRKETAAADQIRILPRGIRDIYVQTGDFGWWFCGGVVTVVRIRKEMGMEEWHDSASESAGLIYFPGPPPRGWKCVSFLNHGGRPLKLDSASRRLITAVNECRITLAQGVVGNTRCGKRPLLEHLSRTILSRYVISYGPSAHFSTFVHGQETRRPRIHVYKYLFNNMYSVYIGTHDDGRSGGYKAMYRAAYRF